MGKLTFEPEAHNSGVKSLYMAVSLADHKRLKEIAKRRGMPLSEIARQALHFALENMGKE